MKFHRNENGFSAVEIVIVVAVVGLLGGGGWYVYNQNKVKTKTTTNQETTVDTTTQLDLTDPLAVSKAFIHYMESGNKQAANSLVSAGFKTEALKGPTNGQDNFYDICKADPLCINNFTYVDVTKATSKTTDDYTDSKGTKGKKVIFTEITMDSEGVKTEKTFELDLIPDGSYWVVDSFVSGSNVNLNVNTTIN